MKKVEIKTTFKKMLADVYTPVGIYLRVRDRFRDTILLESTDFNSTENSYSFIGINAVAGIEISSPSIMEQKLPAQNAERKAIDATTDIPGLIWQFMQCFDVEKKEDHPVSVAQGLFGYTSFDAAGFLGDITKTSTPQQLWEISFVRYRLYQYVIAINHYKDELFLCENHFSSIPSELPLIESLIKNKDVPAFPFHSVGEEKSNLTDDAFIEMVKKGIANCLRGDVFQLVLSRQFERKFIGDEFNVYRSLRCVNPSPYLFYFDYGDYKLFGSSPESQVVINNGKANVHPIAGTIKRTGDETQDKMNALKLHNDEKENAEHVMLVDLARNDLSKMCTDVQVSQYKKICFYSHVIHLVSEVTGNIATGTNPFKILASTFPAGTLSGAPKTRAMQLISQYETTARGYYGGTIGFIGFNGDINHAIMIRTFLSASNTLTYQAGAGVVAASNPQNELLEVNNKLNALKQAIDIAQNII